MYAIAISWGHAQMFWDGDKEVWCFEPRTQFGTEDEAAKYLAGVLVKYPKIRERAYVQRCS